VFNRPNIPMINPDDYPDHTWFLDRDGSCLCWYCACESHREITDGAPWDNEAPVSHFCPDPYADPEYCDECSTQSHDYPHDEE
jgi:hypothetical protein